MIRLLKPEDMIDFAPVGKKFYDESGGGGAGTLVDD